MIINHIFLLQLFSGFSRTSHGVRNDGLQCARASRTREKTLVDGSVASGAKGETASWAEK